jgi:hypothetical protein
MDTMVRIVKGENATFTIRLRDQDGDPFDLTPFDQFRVCLPGIGETPVQVTETVNVSGSVAAVAGNPILGKITVTVKAPDTGVLGFGERQDVDLELNNATTPNPRRTRFKAVLNVEQFCA